LLNKVGSKSFCSWWYR